MFQNPADEVPNPAFVSSSAALCTISSIIHVACCALLAMHLSAKSETRIESHPG